MGDGRWEMEIFGFNLYEMVSNHLFIYGTLLKDVKNPFSAYLAERSTIIGAGHFPGLLFQITWYPGAVFIPEIDYRVYGTIVRLDDPKVILSKLDEYEGIQKGFESSAEYIRRLIPIQTGTERIPCWVYLYQAGIQDKTWIPSGDYLGSEGRKGGE